MALSPAHLPLLRWKNDPVAFVREQFGAEPDPFQLKVLRAFPTNQRIAMKACKGPGKTCVLAWLAWWFLAFTATNNPEDHPKIIATSISEDNLSDGLWSEMAKWQKKSPLLMREFEWNRTTIKHRRHPETWFMAARAWSRSADKSQQADALAGKHAKNILFILDEVGAIPDGVMAAAEAALANGPGNKLVIAGNPTMLSGPLYRACTRERHLWFLVTVTGDPDSPDRSPRIDPKWAMDQIAKYGRDNPWVIVNVFGEFPPGSLNALLGPEECERAMARFYKPDQYSHAPKILGVDVARQGDDRTIIFPRQGMVAFKPVVMRQLDTVAVANRVAGAIDKWKPDAVFIDGTGGYGAGVIDLLRNRHYDVIEVHFSGKALDPRYKNIRAEISWKLAEWIKRGAGAIPDDPELLEELTALQYVTKEHGLFQLKDKELIKAELGRSPDMVDALALTFTYPVQAKPAWEQMGVPEPPSHGGSDYNPLDPNRNLR